MNKSRIGFIGIGNMGMPMAKSLLKNGFQVVAYARKPAALAEIQSAGAIIASSPREMAVSCPTVISAVLDEAQTDQVLFGPEGLWEGFSEGSTLITSSTLSPDYCRGIYEKAKTRKINVIDAPVTDPSGQKHVLGCLTIMVGGDQEGVQQNWPVFQAMGQNIFYFGKIGNGQICKLVHQINAVNIGIVTREALNMGVKAGLDLKNMVEALSLGLGSTRGLQNLADTLKAATAKPQDKPASPQPPGALRERDRTIALNLAISLAIDMPASNFIRGLLSAEIYSAYDAALNKYF